MTNIKLRAGQVVVDVDGAVFRHVVVNLDGEQTIAAFRESPGAWKGVQAQGHLRVKKGDRVDVVAPDGCEMGLEFVVTKAIGGEVWLSKPARMVSLEPESLFSDGAWEVVPVGTQFAIRSVREKVPEAVSFTTAEAARAEILKRQPRQV